MSVLGFFIVAVSRPLAISLAGDTTVMVNLHRQSVLFLKLGLACISVVVWIPPIRFNAGAMEMVGRHRFQKDFLTLFQWEWRSDGPHALVRRQTQSEAHSSHKLGYAEQPAKKAAMPEVEALCVHTPGPHTNVTCMCMCMCMCMCTCMCTCMCMCMRMCVCMCMRMCVCMCMDMGMGT